MNKIFNLTILLLLSFIILAISIKNKIINNKCFYLSIFLEYFTNIYITTI